VDPVKPDYDGPNVRNVLPALLGGRRVEWLPAPVAGARAVVLVVLDGLGWDVASGASPSVATLREIAGLEGRSITTVVPSTTPAALTSITTGLPPSRHGVTGYRMRVDDDVINVIRWQRASGRRPPEPSDVLRHESFGGRAVPVVTKAAFRTSGFTAVHLRDGEFHGWETTAVLVEHVRHLIARGDPLVYAYYPGIDEVAHAYGIDGAWYAAEVAAADRLVGALLDPVPPHFAVLVTADHGQVQVGPDGRNGLGALDELVDA
jgi:predicted AlkP superfamily pyrophosphatase or phosphodiesterase